MNEWVILSLKWSQGSDDYVWYKPKSQGYTADLNRAGRFTKEEARSLVMEGVTLAVPLEAAESLSESVRLVRTDAATLRAMSLASMEGATTS